MLTINITTEAAIRILDVGKGQAARSLNAAKIKYGATHAVTQQLTIELQEIEAAITDLNTTKQK